MATTQLDIKKISTPLEPKKSNRWLVELPDNFNLEKWEINHVTPLRFIRDEETGKYKWADTVITIINTISHNPAQKLSNLIESKKFNNFNFKVTMLGPVGDEVEVRHYKACNIKDINFGATDYTDDKVNKIKITLENKKVIIY